MSVKIIYTCVCMRERDFLVGIGFLYTVQVDFMLFTANMIFSLKYLKSRGKSC